MSKYGWAAKFNREILVNGIDLKEYLENKKIKEVKNMEIDKILVELAEIVGKPKGILTREFNKIKTEKADAGLTTDVLPEDQLQRVILAGVCDKFEIDVSELDKYINDDEEMGGDVISDDEFALQMKGDDEVEDEEDWTSIFNTTPAPKKFSGMDGDRKFESTPLLQIIDRLTYKLRIFDTSKPPRPLSGTNKFGNEYDARLVDVTLVSISDPSLYEDVYESGDKKGEPLFVKNGKYSLWLDKQKGFPEFCELWRDTLGLSKPDDRPFYLKRFKKMSKNGRKYNVFNFAVK